MSGRVSIVLALLLLALGIYALLEDSGGEAAPAHRAPPLLDIDPARATWLSLTRGGESVRVERRGKTWAGTARPDQVDDFLNALGGLSRITEIDAANVQAGDYGLEPPSATIEVGFADRPPLVVHLGRRNPAGTASYARLGSTGPIVLIGAVAAWEIDKTFGLLRTALATASPTAGAAVPR